eukprot:8480295-Pyramimonas_sp.AAC.1
MTVADFGTVREFLEHKAKTVYPVDTFVDKAFVGTSNADRTSCDLSGAYNLNSHNTMWSPDKMRTFDPEKDLDVYKMVDPLVFQHPENVDIAWQPCAACVVATPSCVCQPGSKSSRPSM